MTLEELEQWDADFDAGLIDTSKYQRVPIGGYVPPRYLKHRNHSIDSIGQKILSMSDDDICRFLSTPSGYLSMRRATRAFSKVYAKAEKAKGRYSKNIMTQEQADLFLACRIENAKPRKLDKEYIRAVFMV
jgi:hypothetical protein